MNTINPDGNTSTENKAVEAKPAGRKPVTTPAPNTKKDEKDEKKEVKKEKRKKIEGRQETGYDTNSK